MGILLVDVVDYLLGSHVAAPVMDVVQYHAARPGEAQALALQCDVTTHLIATDCNNKTWMEFCQHDLNILFRLTLTIKLKFYAVSIVLEIGRVF
jgi:hypothetical protein